jgi:hypothetical protein
MLKFPYSEVNKISKIYTQNDSSNNIFEDVESAKQFFMTDQAIELFNKHCYRQRWQLTDHDRSLHWTISFELHTQSTDMPNSDKWRDAKDSMTSMDLWFQQGHHPVIVHDVEHLY